MSTFKVKFSMTLAIDIHYWKAKSKFQWETTVMFFLGASVRLVAAISVAKCYNDESELRSFKRNGRLLANDIGYSKKKRCKFSQQGSSLHWPTWNSCEIGHVTGLKWEKRSAYRISLGSLFERGSWSAIERIGEACYVVTWEGDHNVSILVVH